MKHHKNLIKLNKSNFYTLIRATWIASTQTEFTQTEFAEKMWELFFEISHNYPKDVEITVEPFYKG